MGKAIDLTDMRFGKIVVKRYAGKNKNGQSQWECECDCGKKNISLGTNLKRKTKTIKSCGCQSSINLKKNRCDTTKIHQTGERFGSLVVVSKSERSSYGSVKWMCVCDCGKIAHVSGNALRMGKTISCGCSRIKKIKVGTIFGVLKILKFHDTKNGKSRYLCRCECGKEVVIRYSCLSQGQFSCGCRMGNNYKRLLPEEAYKIKNGNKRRSKYLTDGYISGLLYNNKITDSCSGIPKGLIQLKREQIILHREIKKTKEVINGITGN